MFYSIDANYQSNKVRGYLKKADRDADVNWRGGHAITGVEAKEYMISFLLANDAVPFEHGYDHYSFSELMSYYPIADVRRDYLKLIDSFVED